ncbi:MAG: queuosine precursor transporter [Planctomycetota bacterium]
MHESVDARPSRLFLLLGAFFITNALLAEFVGVKLFSLERTLGFDPLSIRTFVEEPLSFNLTAGVVLWPFVFVLTDIVNEYFGQRGVRRLSFIAVGTIVYAFAMVFLAIRLVPADFWILRDVGDGRTVDMQLAFESVFGQGLWIIAGSVVAFLVGQLVDVFVFHWLKQRTGEKWIWLRATGSTLVSQFLDSFVVLWIAFGLNPQTGWGFTTILSIGLVNYAYKFTMALVMTPVIYAVHGMIERYLGHETAESMRRAAMGDRAPI